MSQGELSAMYVNYNDYKNSVETNTIKLEKVIEQTTFYDCGEGLLESKTGVFSVNKLLDTITTFLCCKVVISTRL